MSPGRRSGPSTRWPPRPDGWASRLVAARSAASCWLRACAGAAPVPGPGRRTRTSREKRGGQPGWRHLCGHRQPVLAQQFVHPDMASGPSRNPARLHPRRRLLAQPPGRWWRIFRNAALAGQSFAGPPEIDQATRLATAQLNTRARPWVWGRPAPSTASYAADTCTPFEESSARACPVNHVMARRTWPSASLNGTASAHLGVQGGHGVRHYPLPARLGIRVRTPAYGSRATAQSPAEPRYRLLVGRM